MNTTPPLTTEPNPFETLLHHETIRNNCVLLLNILPNADLRTLSICYRLVKNPVASVYAMQELRAHLKDYRLANETARTVLRAFGVTS